MSSEQEPFVADDTQVQTKAHDAHMVGADDQFNSKLRKASGSPPLTLTKFDKFMNQVRGSLMFILQFGIACYSIEMIHTYSVKHDLNRLAAEVLRASPWQVDVIIVPGTIIPKFAPRMKYVYNQMPEPEFVVGMRSYIISGDPFQGGYNVIRDAEEVTPVNVHIPGCPPCPETLIYGIAKLQERITNDESSPMTVKPYELEQLGDPERDETADKLAKEINEEDLVT